MRLTPIGISLVVRKTRTGWLVSVRIIFYI
jgi:hypothetical protein